MRMADDFIDSETPLRAEAVISELLGMVWGGVQGPRDQGVAAFCLMVADQLRDRGRAARPLLEVLATQAPGEASVAIRAQADATLATLPEWVGLLERVEFLRACTSMDAFGQQENFIMHFGYRGADAVVGDHVIIALVDHRLGVLKDAFLVGPQMGFDGIRQVFMNNPDVEVTDGITAGYICQQVLLAMQATSELSDLSILGEETAQTWHLLEARMRVLARSAMN